VGTAGETRSCRHTPIARKIPASTDREISTSSHCGKQLPARTAFNAAIPVPASQPRADWKLLRPPASYIEARVRIPTGKGVWPAFWLLGSNFPSTGWPAAGELDLFEANASSPSVVTQRIHLPSNTDPSKDIPYGDGEQSSSTAFDQPVDSAFHTYGVYFDRDLVQFYVDRRPRLSLTAVATRASGRDWPFDEPQFIVLNVAVGGVAKDPGKTSFPRTMTTSGISIWHQERPSGAG